MIVNPEIGESPDPAPPRALVDPRLPIIATWPETKLVRGR